jgi:hypothetical protein
VKASFVLDYELEMSATSKTDVVKELQHDNTIVHRTMFDWEITFDESSTKHQYEKISEA